MNAQTPSLLPAGDTTHELTASMVQNASVLRLLTTRSAFASITELAGLTGKDRSNLSKSLTTLEEDGAIQRALPDGDGLTLRLTDFGRRAVQGFDVAEGRLALPTGYTLRVRAQLQPHPLNPRKDWDSEEAVQQLDEMRESIVLRGIRYPLEIRQGEDGVDYIISGERRWRALGLAIEDGDVADDYPIVCQIKDVDDEQHLILALEENVQRRNLTHLEEARAYAYLRDVLKWGTDRIAENFGGLSRKVVQNKLRLLEPAHADLAAKVEAGELTYHQALKAMIQPKAPQGDGLFGDGLHAQKKGDEVKPLELTPKEALIVIELTDHCDKHPHPMFDGYARITAMPIAGEAKRLQERGVIATRSGMGQAFAKVMLYSANVKTWLADNGFYEDRGELLHRARAAIVGGDKAAAAEAEGRYVTDWLNVADDAPATAAGAAFAPAPPGAGSTPRPPPPLPPLAAPTKAADDEPAALDAEHLCTLVEIAFKAERDQADDMLGAGALALTAGPPVSVPLLRGLIYAGLAAVGSASGYRHGIRLTGDGKDYLADQAFGPIDEDVLLGVREALGYDTFAHQMMVTQERYVTAALNAPRPVYAAGPSPAAQPLGSEHLPADQGPAPERSEPEPARHEPEGHEPDRHEPHRAAAPPAHVQPPSAMDLQAAAEFGRIVSDRLSRNREKGPEHWSKLSPTQAADVVIGSIEDGDFSAAAAMMAALAQRAGHMAAGPQLAQALARHIDKAVQEA